MKVKMKDNLIKRYERILPRELETQGNTITKDFLLSVEGKEIEITFTGKDAFEKENNNIWLPNDLWEEI